LRLVVLKEIPEDANLRQQWNALVARMDQPQVFYTWEWAAAVQRAYSATLRPLLLLGYDDNELLCGVAALASDPERQVSFLCATTGDYCDFIVSGGDAAGFTAQVVRTLRQESYRDILLTNFPEDSPCYAAIRDATDGLHVHARMAYECAQVRLSKLLQDNKVTLPRQKMVRRSLRAIGAGGPLAVASEAEWDCVSPLLPEFFRAHIARFLFARRLSNLVRPERRAFLLELARLLSANGWLCFSRMSAGMRNVAWNYGFKFCGTSFWYQPTFVNDLEKYSPGFVLLSKVIEEATQDSAIETVDLGLGAEAYKEAFANASRRTMCVTLHRSRWKHWKDITRYRMASAIAAWPRAEQIAQNLLGGVEALKARLRLDGVRETCLWAMRRTAAALAARDEVFFYELSDPDPALLESDELILKEMDMNTLADVAVQNSDDKSTLAYVLRCAGRLRENSGSVGFALANPAGELLHFTWAQPYESFHWPELDSGLPPPAANSVVLFDSWTPVSQTGRGYYDRTLARVVAKMRQDGKRSWGFSVSTNSSCMRGFENAGFRRSFSVSRYRLLWWQKIVQRSGAVPVCS
jgi:CelD/BcsL family acetyltransferase involved in cellulose biosynthesis